jgi:hypothetical protein
MTKKSYRIFFSFVILHLLCIEVPKLSGQIVTPKNSIHQKSFRPYICPGINLAALCNFFRIDFGIEYKFRERCGVRLGFSKGNSSSDLTVKEKTNCLILEGRFYPIKHSEFFLAPYAIYRTGIYSERWLIPPTDTINIKRIINFSAVDVGLMIGFSWDYYNINISPFVGLAHEFYLSRNAICDRDPQGPVVDNIFYPYMSARLGVNLSYKFPPSYKDRGKKLEDNDEAYQ